ncbi:MAG TPA: tetratricopeptide repeat protein [Candidatus Thermoplasmatota archaeon]
MPFGPLTVQDRIVLHLMEYQNFSDKYEVPNQVTQRGIGECIDIAWSNVPRAMKKLVVDQIVEEKSARIKGDKRKKKAYFLTHKGFSQALTLREDLAGRVITLVDGDAEREVQVGNLPKETGLSFSFLSFAMRVTTEGRLDLARAKATGATPAGVVELIEGAPVVRAFVGRDSELSQVSGPLAQGQTVVIWGVAGVGKSTLAVKSLEALRGKRSIFYLRVRTWHNLNSVLTPLSKFLGKLRRAKLLLYMSTRKQYEVGDLAPILREDFENIDAVLYFDDIQDAPQELQHFLRMLVETAPEFPGLAMVLVSRPLPHIIDRREVAVTKRVVEVKLEGLDKASARLLVRPEILQKPEEFEEVYKRTGGVPLLLELAQPAARPALVPDAAAFVHNEILKRLSPGASATVALASAFRTTVRRDALLSLPGADPSHVRELADLDLLQERPDGRYDIHDLVREFVYSRLTPQQLVEMHTAAATFLAASSDPRDVLERIHHLERAGRSDAAALAAVTEGWKLITAGLYRELLGTVENLSGKGLEAAGVMALDELKSDLYAKLEAWERAFDHAKAALDRSVELGRSEDAGRLYSKLAWLESQRGFTQAAVEHFNRAIELLSVAGQAGASDLVHAELNLGVALHRLGEVAEAAAHLERAAKVGRGAGRSLLVAEAQLLLARILTERGDLAHARERANEAITLLEGAEGTEQSRAEALLVLGELALREKHFDEAIGHLEESLELCEELEILDLAVKLTQQLVEAYTAIGDTENADHYARKAQEWAPTL